MPTKFKWQKPDQESLDRENRQQKEQKGGLFDSIIRPEFNRYKTKKGENKLRLLPPTFGNKKYFAYPIFVHYGCGPDGATYLCMERMYNEPCAVCDERANLRAAGDAEAAKEIGPKNAYIAWAIDRTAEDDVGPVVFQYGYTMGQSIATVSIDDETGRTLCIFDPYEGYDLTFVREDKGGSAKNVGYIGHKIARRETRISNNEALMNKWLDFISDNPLPDVLQTYDYEHVAKCFRGQIPTVRDDEADDDELPAPRTSRGSVRDDDPPASLAEEIDDEIPDHPRRSKEEEEIDKKFAQRGRGDDQDEDEDDDPPFDTETGEIKETPRDRTPERVRADTERVNEGRQRPRLNDTERGRAGRGTDVRERAGSAVERLRERRGARA